MSVAVAKKVIHDFLSASDTGILVLKGRWGVGKTYFWRESLKQYVKDHPTNMWPKKYAYVSVFGAQSGSMLGESLLYQRVNIDRVATSESSTTRMSEFAPIIKDVARTIPYLKNIAIDINRLSPMLLFETLVCLDDIERVGSDKKAMQEILGFATQLREERGCKVILILNDEELGLLSEDFQRYREKVVDIELTFEPSLNEAIEIGIPLTTPFRTRVVEYVKKLNIRNIRVLRRISTLVDDAHKSFGKLHESVMVAAIPSIVLFAYAYYERTKGSISIEFIRKYNRLATYFNKENNVKPNEDEQRWEDLLKSYGYRMTNNFDACLIDFIERGYIEDIPALDIAREIDAQARLEEQDVELKGAWMQFRDAFALDDDDFKSKLFSGTMKVLGSINPENIDSSICMLRRLGDDDRANELIDKYVELRMQEAASLFDPDRPSLLRELRDESLRERLQTAFESQRKLPTVREALVKIGQERGWGVEEDEALRAVSEDQIYDLFRNEKDKLSVVVSAALSYRDHKFGNDDRVSQLANKALDRLADLSLLNAIRVKRLRGIDD
jgi:hypothetical protein